MLLNDVVFSLSSLFAAGVWVLQVIFVKVCYIMSQARGIDDLFGYKIYKEIISWIVACLLLVMSYIHIGSGSFKETVAV